MNLKFFICINKVIFYKILLIISLIELILKIVSIYENEHGLIYLVILKIINLLIFSYF